MHAMGSYAGGAGSALGRSQGGPEHEYIVRLPPHNGEPVVEVDQALADARMVVTVDGWQIGAVAIAGCRPGVLIGATRPR